MLIRLYWTQCTLARLESEPIDTFWIEATQQEAEIFVFPYCSSDTVTKSQVYGISDRKIAAKLGNSARSYCFLVAQDLSTIIPFPVYYPYSPMWEAHSPFKPIAEHHLDTLEELQTFVPTLNSSEIIKAKAENSFSYVSLRQKLEF